MHFRKCFIRKVDHLSFFAPFFCIPFLAHFLKNSFIHSIPFKISCLFLQVLKLKMCKCFGFINLIQRKRRPRAKAAVKYFQPSVTLALTNTTNAKKLSKSIVLMRYIKKNQRQYAKSIADSATVSDVILSSFFGGDDQIHYHWQKSKFSKN